MRIGATKRHGHHRRIGLLLPDEDAGLVLLSEYHYAEPEVVFVPYPVLRSFLKRGIGVAYGRRHRLNRWEWKPRSMAYVLPRNIENDCTLEHLALARDWVEAHGGTFSSPQGTAMSLLRASLDQPLVTATGGPPLERIAGGRMHSSKHAVYPAVEVWDISAAFASTLATFRPCGQWNHERVLRDDGDQFITCRVRVPMMAQWGPLPTIPKKQYSYAWLNQSEYPQDVTITGTWTGDEVRSAITHGATLERIEQVYTLRPDGRQPFTEWWERLQRGRRLDGPAGQFLKAVSNSLWGIFAATKGGAYKEWWTDGRQHREPIPDNPVMEKRRDLALADTLSARVRRAVFDQFIVPLSPNVLAVWVDGGLTLPGDPPVGDRWRLKDKGSHCHFVNGSAYRYTRDSGEIVAHAGMPSDRQNRERLRLFERDCFGQTDLPLIIDPSPDQRVRLAFPGSVVFKERLTEPPTHDRLGGANR